MNASSIFVIIPAYNEEQVIGSVLNDLMAFGYSIVVVDDGSRDATYHTAEQFPVHLLQHECNLGQGAALQTGISYVLGLNKANAIVTFDADGQHDPVDIARVVNPIIKGKCDVVLGSRFLEKDLTSNLKLDKYLTLRMAVIITRLSTGLVLTDTHNGFRAFSPDAARKIKITQNGMAHASQLLKQIARQHLIYQECPVKISYTAYSLSKGQSIMNGINILWDSFWGGE